MCKHTFETLLMLPHMDFSSLAHHIVVGGKVWDTQGEAARGLIQVFESTYRAALLKWDWGWDNGCLG